MSGTILVWSMGADTPSRAVYGELCGRGCDVIFVDQRDFGDISASVSLDGAIDGELRIGTRTVSLHDVRGMYLRPYDATRLRKVREAGERSALHHRAFSLDQVLLSWAELCEGLVINPPEAMALNNTKPGQLMVIAQHGLRVPQTLVTTDPEAVRAFAGRHARIIYKSVSGARSIVSMLESHRLAQLDAVCSCPTQFQEWIPGVDVRVHVVGARSFASEVVSEADDYRYAQDSVMQSCSLDAELTARLVAMTHAMGLIVAGIDLRRTPEGEWFCLEVNPSPGFTYYESDDDHSIRIAIADLLTIPV